MSEHTADVIRVSSIEKHPNADNLDLIKIYDYECIVRKGQFNLGDLAIYIFPDTLVKLSRHEFSFLQKPGKEKEWHRIAVMKLRGVYSQGLLIPAALHMKEGDNAWEYLELEHYQPDIPNEFNSESAPVKGPQGHYPVYDLENWRKHTGTFLVGEEVWITEKVHGSNARYKWDKDKQEIAVATHYKWTLKEDKSIWWQALKDQPWIEEFCRNNPDLTLYGEVFGHVKNFRYGAKPTEIFFRVFDIWNGNRWMDAEELLLVNGIELMPTLYIGPYEKGTVLKHMEGMTTFNAEHIREGCVVKPMKERRVHAGRVALKAVSNAYLEMK